MAGRYSNPSTRYNMQQMLAAIGAAGAGLGGYGASRIRNLFGENPASTLGRARAGLRSVSGKKRKKGSKGRAKVRLDGTTGRVVTIKRKKPKRRKKKKFNAKKEINKLKKNMPKFSKKTFRDFKTMCLSFNQPNEHRIFNIKCFDKSTLENYVSNLTKVDDSTVADYSTENTSVRMDTFYKLMLKNNMTSNANFQYAFFLCKDDDNESPVDSIREELVDRGYTAIPGVSGISVATPTSSEIPERLSLGEVHDYHVPAFTGGALNRNWKIQGKVRKAVLGPGDGTDLIWSRSNYVYKQEEKDQENAFAHIKGMSLYLVISVHGDLAHDQTNFTLVGRGRCQLDCEEQLQTTVTYFNPKGLNEVKYTDNLTNTGFTIPVHADNMQSAMEIDDN